jgi:hypothetical protein
LSGLKDAANQAETKAMEYEQLLEQTVDRNKAIADNRKVLDQAAKNYMNTCYSF